MQEGGQGSQDRLPQSEQLRTCPTFPTLRVLPPSHPLWAPRKRDYLMWKHQALPTTSSLLSEANKARLLVSAHFTELIQASEHKLIHFCSAHTDTHEKGHPHQHFCLQMPMFPALTPPSCDDIDHLATTEA